MSTENKSTQDDIPTVDLDIDNTSKESPASQSTENTGSDENGNNSPSDADEQTDVELHYDGDYDNAGFDWVGEGQHISIERVSETETEILLRTHVEESIGLASMILNPAELRAMHLQLGSVIESQNYESWVPMAMIRMTTSLWSTRITTLKTGKTAAKKKMMLVVVGGAR